MKPFELDKLLRVFHDHYVNRETTSPDGAYEIYSRHYYPSLEHPHGKVEYLVPCDNAKRISDITTGKYDSFGDSIHETLEDAQNEANFNRDRDIRSIQAAERLRQEEAERKEREAAERERHRYGGFTDGMTPLQIGKISAVLDEYHSYIDNDIKSQPWKRLYEHIQSFIAQGFKFGGSPNNTGKSMTYHVEIPRISMPNETLWFKLPKIAIDYARFLGGDVESQESLTEKMERQEMHNIRIKYDLVYTSSDIEKYYNQCKRAASTFNDKKTKDTFADISRLYELYQKYEQKDEQKDDKIERKYDIIVRQYKDLKAKYPDSVVVLFRVGDFYEVYMEDAEIVSKTLGITLTKIKHNLIQQTMFPHYELDTYLPRLVRAGLRICICDLDLTKSPA